jgi:tetratricopeptide (TPR) repeat protein
VGRLASGHRARDQRRRGPVAGLLVALAALAIGAADGGTNRLEEARRLAASSDLGDLERAAVLYEARLADDPQDFDALVGAARALNAVMTIRTHANLPLVNGLQDTEENRALWKDIGGRAVDYARRAQEQQPDSVDASAERAKAFMYYVSSMGIIKSIVTGAGIAYLDHAAKLRELDAHYDSGLGDYLLGAFWMVAPPPLRNLDRSLSYYERAAGLAPSSVRNQFGLGVYWARREEPVRARSHFEKAVALPCVAGTESLVCDWLKDEARRSVERLRAVEAGR